MGTLTDSLLGRLIRPFSRILYLGSAQETWMTMKLGAGMTWTNDAANQCGVLAVDPTAAGYVPATRTVNASLPLRVNAGASATLAADITLSCNSASGAAAGSMSAAHYTLVNGATASPTANALCKRGTTGEVCGAWFATALTGIAGAGVVKLVSGDQTVIAAKGASNATIPLMRLASTGTELVLGEDLEVTDVTVNFLGGAFTVTNTDGAVDVLTIDAGAGTCVIAPGPGSVATTITDTGIALAGTSNVKEVNCSQDFALWTCASGSSTPSVPLATWTKGSNTFTLGGHGASTTANVVVDAVTNVSLEVGGTKVVECTAARLGLLGVTPVSQAAAYTQTYSTAARTNAFAATSAYTGQDNLQVGGVYAKAADIEALRQEVLALAKLMNAVIDDSQGIGIAG